MISVFLFCSFPFLQPVIQSIGIEVILELFGIELSTPGVKLATNGHEIFFKKNCFSLIALVSSLMTPIRKKWEMEVLLFFEEIII